MVQPWDYIHAPGESGLTVESYLNRTEHGTGNPADSINTLFAQPWFTGELDLLVASFGVRVSTIGGVGTEALVDLAVYESTSERNIYPSNRIWQSVTPIKYDVLGPQLRAAAQTFAAGKLYWFVTNTGGGTGSHVCAFNGQALNLPVGVLGWLPATATGATMLSVARSYALGMPATFPAGAAPIGGPGFVARTAPAIIVVPQP